MYLYHYTEINKAQLILEQGELKASRVLDCNDPFEMDNTPAFVDFGNERLHKWFCREIISLYMKDRATFSKDPSFMKTLLQKESPDELFLAQRAQLTSDKLLPLGDSQFMTEAKRSAYIYCFSAASVNSNILMWSHYGRGHAGVALEFDFEPAQFNNRLLKVTYPKKNIRGGVFSPKDLIDLLTNSSSKMTQEWFFRKTSFIKHKDWEYEQEWRFISYPQDPEHRPCIKIGRGLVTAVYLGLKVAENEEREKLISLIREKYSHMKIFVANKNKKFLKINFDQLPMHN